MQEQSIHMSKHRTCANCANPICIIFAPQIAVCAFMQRQCWWIALLTIATVVATFTIAWTIWSDSFFFKSLMYQNTMIETNATFLTWNAWGLRTPQSTMNETTSQIASTTTTTGTTTATMNLESTTNTSILSPAGPTNPAVPSTLMTTSTSRVTGLQNATSTTSVPGSSASSVTSQNAMSTTPRSMSLKPNIVWIMADDLGWGEVGLYPANSKHGRLRTPYLDQFGREGVAFRHAYAGYCVCAPSRMSFFTGKHSGRFVAMGLDGMSLRPEQNVSTFPEVLQSAGYVTAAFGKTSPLTAPLRQGFQVFLGQVSQGLCHNMYPRHIDQGKGQLNFALFGNFANKSRDLCMENPERYNYTIDVFHDAAMAWLEEVSKAPGPPFFLYMSYTIPHAGGWGDYPKMPESGQPVPLDMGYTDRTWPSVERDHAATVSYMDLKIGQLMKHLQTLGIDEKPSVP